MRTERLRLAERLETILWFVVWKLYLNELLPLYPRLRLLLLPPRLGQRDSERARRRRAGAPVHSRAARERRDPRRVLERGDERDALHRLHAQLHEDLLGQEGPGMERIARGGLRDNTLPQQQVLPRRTRPELVRQPRLGLRPARPGLEGAGGVWHGALHVRWRAGAQGQARRVRRESGAPYEGR